MVAEDGSGRAYLLPPAPLALRFTRPDGSALRPEDEASIKRHRSAAFGRYPRLFYRNTQEALNALHNAG